MTFILDQLQRLKACRLRSKRCDVFSRYEVHAGLTIILMVESAIDTVEVAGYGWDRSVADVTNLATLLLACVFSHRLSTKLVKPLWAQHFFTVAVANFFAVAFEAVVYPALFLVSGEMAGEITPISAFPQEYISDFKYTALFWAFAEGIRYLIYRSTMRDLAIARAEVSVVRTGFFRDLPPGFPDEIDLIEAQENYIGVSAGDQTASILYRFKDAIAEMGNEVGLQVHRSYWVRKRAIVSYRKLQGRGELVLQSGRQVPVSRTYMKQVEDYLASR